MRHFITRNIIFILSFTYIFGGSISGNVKYNGKKKKPRTIKMDADPVCGTSHNKPVFKQSLIIDAENNIKNTIVYLENIDYKGEIPKTQAILDQNGCVYVPHVLGVMKGQEVLIKNSDATLHNIHGLPEENAEFNFAMPKVVKEKKSTFSTAEPDPFYIKCDVHPWMKAWILVSDHPYFAVTDSKGNFSIDGIPSGTYEVVCWQEKFKKNPLTSTVTIGDGETTQDFTFTRPKKK